MEILHQYTIKADCEKTVLVEKGDKKRHYAPIAAVYDDGRENPLIVAGLLRDLAKWAIEQAEIIEDFEESKNKPKEIYSNGKYTMVAVVE